MAHLAFGYLVSHKVSSRPASAERPVKMKERIVKINSLNYEVTFTQNIVGRFALQPDRAKINRT